MATLQVRNNDRSAIKQKAIEDAKMMQAAVRDECEKASQEVPAYNLEELIGKGSFGRVYKASDLHTKALVAVKIIDIDEGDTSNPKLADTYGEFMKEINALKLLRDSGAKHINHVLDVLPVGQSMWMVTEHCAGGSVATLMKPTPTGLQEKWIIPILRDVAEAIMWVHKEGIIHRDIKCANVLITEEGDVQLCDFGVAGVIENRFDKRSTFIGTPHWMAPELFDQNPSYGSKVDIWAFGSMVHEIATGRPPNVMGGFSIQALGNYIKTHTPRLEGDRYSEALKDLVAFCLVEDPHQRPSIEEVQNHSYIFNTEAEYPSGSLINLVKAYRMWEAQGGSRQSLFDPGGAQGLQGMDYSSLGANDEWNFSTTLEFDQQVFDNTDAQAVYDVYGSNIDFEFPKQTSQTAKPKGSRRRPPPQLPTIKAPLEKLFDPNTITSYADNSLAYYGQFPPPPPSSDLPLRNDSLHQTLRESLIDLDVSLHGDELSKFVDMDTIRPGPRISTDDVFDDMTDLNKPPLSDPADLQNNRRTQDWKFPSMQPPASANPDVSRFPFNEDRSSIGSGGLGSGGFGSGGRPSLLHQSTDPIGLQQHTYHLMVPQVQDSRPVSVSSLIDLDESLALPDLTRPSTANSDAASMSGSEMGGANPFDLERHASLYQPLASNGREPSIYVSDASDLASLAKPSSVDMTNQFTNGHDEYSNAQYANGHYANGESQDSGYEEPASDYGANGYVDAEYLAMGDRQSNGQPAFSTPRRNEPDGPMPELPVAPAPPSAPVMQGLASRDEVRDDVMRMLAAFRDHLSFANAHLSSLPVRYAGSQNSDGGDMRQ